MDLVTSCKDKLSYFRIKELKDVLTQLGLSKQGKKQDLVDRILAILSDDQVSRMWAKKNAVRKEEVAKLVEDTYRKMQVSGATELASLGQGVSDTGSLKLKEEIDDPYQSDSKVRCLCGSSLRTESMIKCDDPKCHVWQHLGCVIIPEKPTDGDPSHPQIFFCEICRLARADPFWLTVAHPLYPVKLNITVPTEGTNPVQTLEKTFQLTRADKELLSRQDYDVQAWCMLLNDKVSYRMQWPQYADLQVNGVPVRAINRPGSQLLGANGRDDGPIITPCTKDGINKICLTGCDARIFCLGVRLVKRRSLQQILNLIPKESEGETFEYALARVRRCVGGGSSKDNADSDSDLEVVAESITFNLRCPMSGSRIKVAGRFKPCLHMVCFDLHVFVEMNQRSRKWQCPTCLKNYSLESIIIDPYFNRITSMMQSCGDDVTDIEVKPDGSWRVKAKSENEKRDLGDLGLWHLPDGALIFPSQNEVKAKMEKENVKQEVISEGHTNLKLRKNPNGHWEVRKPEDMRNHLSSGNNHEFVDGEPKIIPMSSSATISGRDKDDPSVNQDGDDGNYEFSMNNGMEYDSKTLNAGVELYALVDQNVSTQGNTEVIVLSDSEEDEPMVSLGPAGKNRTDISEVNFCVPHHGIPDPFPNDPTLGTVGGPCFGLFNDNNDEYEMTMWPLPPSNQVGASFQLFGSDAGASRALDDLQQGSMNCSSSINGYSLAPDTGLGSTSLRPGSSVHHADANDGLVDNPMAFSGADPSLQIFLPTKPSDTSVQSDMIDQGHVSNGIRADDWISLRLGGSPNGSHEEPAPATALDSRDQLPFTDCMGSLRNSAPLRLNMNGDRPDKGSRPRSESDSPFSFPRQKRSVRPRLYLSIDSESE